GACSLELPPCDLRISEEHRLHCRGNEELVKPPPVSQPAESTCGLVDGRERFAHAAVMSERTRKGVHAPRNTFQIPDLGMKTDRLSELGDLLRRSKEQGGVHVVRERFLRAGTDLPCAAPEPVEQLRCTLRILSPESLGLRCIQTEVLRKRWRELSQSLDERELQLRRGALERGLEPELFIIGHGVEESDSRLDSPGREGRALSQGQQVLLGTEALGGFT